MPRAPLTFLLLGIGALPTRAEPQAVPVLTSVTLSQSSVTGGASVTGTVTLSENAGEGGIAVLLVSSKTSLATLAGDKVVVQPGVRTASFVVQTKPVAASPNAVAEPPFVEIAAEKWVSGSGPGDPPRPVPPQLKVRLTVLPPALASLTVTPSNLPGGTAATGEVRLTGPAPAGGLTLTLASKLTGAEPARAIGSGVRQSPVSVPAQSPFPPEPPPRPSR